MVLNWNVRGLNNRARRQVVRDLVNETRCTIAALQETKLEVFQLADVTEVLGARFSNHFVFLPAQDTRGGVLLAVVKIITQSLLHNSYPFSHCSAAIHTMFV